MILVNWRYYMLIKFILGLLSVLVSWYSITYIMDTIKHKHEFKKGPFLKSIGIGFITDFFDTLGIGSFATTTAILKSAKMSKDKVLPGTLNVSHTIPMALEAFIFITAITVDPITLLSMIGASVVGAWLGAGIISKLPEKSVQLTMGVALFATAVLMLLGQLNPLTEGGDAFGLTGTKLIIGIIGNFVLGALATAGIGLYAPCMALVYFLGMSPVAAFPIMMGSCAFLGPVASIKFIKEKSYDRRVSFGITLGGVVGVLIAAFLVKSLPLNTLRWLVIGVIVYTSATMLESGLNNKLKAKNLNKLA
jgi:uncharacterized membrane protein YfcA